MRPTGAILIVPAEGWWEAFGLAYRPAASLSAFGLSFLAFDLSFSAFGLWDPQYFFPQNQLPMTFLALPDHFQQKNFFFIFGQTRPPKKIHQRGKKFFFLEINFRWVFSPSQTISSKKIFFSFLVNHHPEKKYFTRERQIFFFSKFFFFIFGQPHPEK